MEVGRQRQIESAGRCLAAALAQTDMNKVAALLRATAKYLETDDVRTERSGEIAALRPGAVRGYGV